ncbi:hypothetical protein [Mycobacterium sp. M26]|uniref:hypothetical protein n=1 Tax=Mycobacterium sp. M26 TaxID=1762962 RepID=UPI00073EF6F3|nr:hypothetical protein [Mycobacterium sp. M26]
MKLRRRGTSPENLPAQIDDDPVMSARVLSQILERSTRVQAPAVKAYVARLRRLNPDASPAEIVTKLENRYLAAVMASGAAVGSAAAFPGIGTLAALSAVAGETLVFLEATAVFVLAVAEGTLAALSAVAGETLVFLEATAVFVLAVAEVYGIPLEERERRRALVLAVLVGDDSKGAIADLVGPGRTNGAWLAEGAEMLPLPLVSQLNTRLMRYFVKRFTIKRSAMALGKMLPVGIGAAVGGGGNRLMGKKIISNARAAFGPAPARWPVMLHLLPAVADER